MNSDEALNKKMNNLISTVKNTEAELKDPVSLTEDIMLAVGDGSNNKNEHPFSKTVILFRNRNFRRLLSAAAVILFMVFTYEQYVVLDKVNRLEKQHLNAGIYNSWELRTTQNFNHIKHGNKNVFYVIRMMGKETFSSKYGGLVPENKKITLRDIARTF